VAGPSDLTPAKERHVSETANLTAAIDRLSACLAELDSQLGRAGPFDGPVPVSAFKRMEFALAILEQEADPVLEDALSRLNGILQQIHHTLTSVPERCDPQLDPAWDHLAGFLEKLLERLDAGARSADLAGDPGWREATGRLERAAGPLSVMDTLEDGMADWLVRWGSQDLDPRTTEVLNAGWRRLRDKGDRLFAQGLLDSFADGPGKNV